MRGTATRAAAGGLGGAVCLYVLKPGVYADALPKAGHAVVADEPDRQGLACDADRGAIRRSATGDLELRADAPAGDWLAGTLMVSRNWPLAGFQRFTCPPPQPATHNMPSASMVMPSGMPYSREMVTAGRRLPISPVASS